MRIISQDQVWPLFDVKFKDESYQLIPATVGLAHFDITAVGINAISALFVPADVS